MSTIINKSFTAVGSGALLYVANVLKFSYSISGTFVGTVLLERSVNGGASFEPLLSFTDVASGVVQPFYEAHGGVHYRFRCSAFTSGTIVTSMEDDIPSVGSLIEATDVVSMSLFDVSFNITFKKIGNLVIAQIPLVSIPDSLTNDDDADAVIPSGFAPSADKDFAIITTVDGAVLTGTLTIDSDGSVVVDLDNAGLADANSVATLHSTAVCWIV